ADFSGLQSRLDDAGDVYRDLVLEIENIFERAVETIGNFPGKALFAAGLLFTRTTRGAAPPVGKAPKVPASPWAPTAPPHGGRRGIPNLDSWGMTSTGKAESDPEADANSGSDTRIRVPRPGLLTRLRKGITRHSVTPSHNARRLSRCSAPLRRAARMA